MRWTTKQLSVFCLFVLALSPACRSSGRKDDAGAIPEAPPRAAPPKSAGALPARPGEIKFAPIAFEPPAANEFRSVLGSGVPVYLLPSREIPLIEFTFSFKGGRYLEEAAKAGVAQATFEMLRRGGTATRTAESVDEELDFLAAQCRMGAGDERSFASLNTMKANLDQSFALFMDLLRSPGFQASRFEIYKQETIEDMKQRNDDADSILSREWDFLLYGEEHYRGRQPTIATLSAIAIEDMRAFHQALVHPGNLIIGVTGDFEPKEMSAFLDAQLAGWKSGARSPDPPAPAAQLRPGVYHVEKEIPQGKVMIGLRSIKRDDPDFFRMLVLNEVLGGGGFTSRITNRVRTEEGLAYSAGSSLQPGVYYPGEFIAYFQSKNRTVALSTKLILETIEELRSEPVSDEELATAKASFIETFPRVFASKDAVVRRFIDDEWTGRKSDYYKNYRANIGAVTAEDLRRSAQKYLAPDKMAIVVVGKWSEIEPGDLDGRASMRDFFGGRATSIPLRDPLTLEAPGRPGMD